MGIEIKTDDARGSYPRSGTTTLTCDIAASMFCRGFATFATGDYIADRAEATRLGWLERLDTKRGCLFVCPTCREEAR